MIKVIISGCNGAMGQTLTKIAAGYDDVEIVAGFDITDSGCNNYAVYTDVSDLELSADVVVDFSHPAALEGVLEFAKRVRMPAVLATTGYEAHQITAIEDASREIPIFRSANMSLGINLMIDLIKKAVKVLGESFDIEVIDRHHRQKLDAPSGTALMLADAINKERSGELKYVYDRHSERRKRDCGEIGIHSIRGGTIVGDHTVLFAGNNELIEITHSAASREVFAEGAIKALRFMVGKAPGMYNMDDLIRAE